MAGTPATECLAIADKAVGLDPRLPFAYLHRGVLEAETGQKMKARSDFERLLELESGNEKANRTQLSRPVG